MFALSAVCSPCKLVYTMDIFDCTIVSMVTIMSESVCHLNDIILCSCTHKQVASLERAACVEKILWGRWDQHCKNVHKGTCLAN